MDGCSLLENLTVPALYEVFPDQDDMPEVRAVSSELIPAPYRSLLVHTSHMTVTVEKFFQEKVDVDVLAVEQSDDVYARKILLRLESTGKAVQFGIVHIDLKKLAEPVREQIVGKGTPLGRVLIENDVLRDVRPTGFFQVTAQREDVRMVRVVGTDADVWPFGRNIYGQQPCDSGGGDIGTDQRGVITSPKRKLGSSS